MGFSLRVTACIWMKKKTKQVTVSENKEDLKDRSIEDYCTVKEKPQTIEDKICPSNYFWLL